MYSEQAFTQQQTPQALKRLKRVQLMNAKHAPRNKNKTKNKNKFKRSLKAK